MASLFIGVSLLIAIEKGPVVLRKGQSGIAHKVANRRKAEGSRQKAEVRHKLQTTDSRLTLIMTLHTILSTHLSHTHLSFTF